MKKINNLEITNSGNANGISLQLQKIIQDEGVERSLTQEEKQFIIEDATDAYGKFLDALGVDWRNDPNSADTPKRVAKKYINDIWKGRYEILGDVTAFPSDGYSGIVLEKDIPLTSVCSHHHESILGKVHIAYIPGDMGKVIGLSKLNRVVEHFGRRGAIQEQLTMAVHNAIDKICEGNIGVMVMIQATHNCVCTRGVRHSGASMMTSHVSGVFADHEKTAKQEVINMIRM
jgi:GTP cyclohydrolase I